MDKLMIVDDSEEIRKQLKWALGVEYSLLLAGTAADALELARKHRPRTVVLDLGLPPDADGTSEGFRCLRELLAAAPFTKVIIVTGTGDAASALRAVQSGAYDHLRKPLDLSELKVIVKRAFHLHGIEEENRKLRLALDKKSGPLTGIIGQCPAMVGISQRSERWRRPMWRCSCRARVEPARSWWRAPSMRRARAGSGISSRSTAERSPRTCWSRSCSATRRARSQGPTPGSRARSSTPRAEPCSWTRSASCPAPLQVKLLRFLQDKTIQRVGGREEITVDVRILAATNRVLTEEITSGRFREDLYYRIGVVTIALPPCATGRTT